MPVTTGIFYSASGPNNRIFNNKFYVTKTNETDNAPVFALYIGSGYNSPVDNPLFYNNYIETNDKAAWIANFYVGLMIFGLKIIVLFEFQIFIIILLALILL